MVNGLLARPGCLAELFFPVIILEFFSLPPFLHLMSEIAAQLRAKKLCLLGCELLLGEDALVFQGTQTLQL